MMEVKTLKSRFGIPLAKQILQEKRTQEETKNPDDPVTYWMKSPDTGHEAHAGTKWFVLNMHDG